MYRWLRNTHLVLGLSFVLFLLVYGLSAIQMAHQSWFSPRPKIIETQVAVRPESRNNPRAMARELMDRYGLRGELKEVEQTADGYELRIERPGTTYEAGEAKVRTRVANFIEMLNVLHHVAGFRQGYFLTRVWGVFVGLVSGGLSLLALTGIYLWFKISSERIVGAVLLASSLCYSLTLIVLLRTA